MAKEEEEEEEGTRKRRKKKTDPPLKALFIEQHPIPMRTLLGREGEHSCACIPAGEPRMGPTDIPRYWLHSGPLQVLAEEALECENHSGIVEGMLVRGCQEGLLGLLGFSMVFPGLLLFSGIFTIAQNSGPFHPLASVSTEGGTRRPAEWSLLRSVWVPGYAYSRMCECICVNLPMCACA